MVEKPLLQYNFNCYGFLNHCIKLVHEGAYDEMVHHMHALKAEVPLSIDGTPCPFNYAAILQRTSLVFWKTISSLEEVQEGDIFVMLRTNFVPSENPACMHKRTGTHMVLVDQVGSKVGDSFHFSVIDCTRRAHNEHDSRYPSKHGIGRSPMILTPAADHYKLQWSSSGRKFRKKLTIGRLLRTYSKPDQ